MLGGELTWLISRGDGVGGRGKRRGFQGAPDGSAPQGVSVAENRKRVRLNTFCLDCTSSGSFIGSHERDEDETRWCWRKDLAEFRGLTDRERTGFLLVLEWFENFRLRHELAAGREAARAFWQTEVLREGRPREDWQLEQWEEALHWYLKWLEACAEAEADHRSLPERVRAAVQSAGGRRGVDHGTKRCYGAWAARYAACRRRSGR